MKYLVLAAGLLAVSVLMGCDVDDDPLASHPFFAYEVSTLRNLPEAVDATFGDLNENGQALWHEGEQVILWDNGSVLEVPVDVGKFLGPSGEVVGNFSVWLNGQLTELPGMTQGITEDGTIYLAKNDTLFTWRGGLLEATNRPVGLVGPEGRIWQNRTRIGLNNVEESSCGFYLDGEWHGRFRPGFCTIASVEENGWAGIGWFGHGEGGWFVGVHEVPWAIIHVNSKGQAISDAGDLFTPTTEDTVNLSDGFPEIRTGAINDDGEILAQLDDRVILLKPR